MYHFATASFVVDGVLEHHLFTSLFQLRQYCRMAGVKKLQSLGHLETIRIPSGFIIH